MKKKLKKINILSLLAIIVLIVFLFFLCRLNVLPSFILCLVIGLFVILTTVGIILLNLKKKVWKGIGIILLILEMLIWGVGTYYIYYGVEFLDSSFSNVAETITKKFYVVTYQENDSENITEISYYKDTNDIEDALQKLENVESNTYDDLSPMFLDLKEKTIAFVLIDEVYNVLFELDTDLHKEDYKIVKEIEIEYQNETTKKDAKDIFNLYIGGNDFTGRLMDFNMIVSVNLETGQVLLTSIPRDYYIEEYGAYGKKDTLSYMGPNGIEVNKKSLENLFDITIDYYMHINTTSLVKLVDAVGGINFCSDEAFTTTHALVLDTYDDSTGAKFYVQKGCQDLNGIQALTVARERKNVNGGDRQRQKNCQNIMIAIFNKLKSTNTITNYNQILNSLKEFYETDMPKDVVTKVVKTILNGKNFNITNQSVNGTDGHDYVHLTTLKDWVMYPDMETVTKAREEIVKVTLE